MAHGTETAGNMGITKDEHKLLVRLLKHPKIKELAKEIEDNETKK